VPFRTIVRAGVQPALTRLLIGGGFALLIARKIRHSPATQLLQEIAVFHVMSRSVLIVASLACLVLSGGPAPAMQLSPEQADLYSSVSINPPSPNGITVCYGFVCRRRASLDFTASDQKQLSQIMAAGKASAAAERAAVQKAVVWFDKRMGPVLGTTTRVSRADIRSGADASNYDCWDSTRNVSSLLLVLQEWSLLKHHTVGNPRYRGNILAMQLPHNTAVLVEKVSRVEWVVDMWTTRYAQPPDVKLVEQWLKEE
jgi:hypothetical protein